MLQNRFFIAFLLTAAFLPGTLAAQYSPADAGQYVILSAQYGTANRHVDVTNRLKELARQDNIFRMGNASFGEDPDPGHVKTLRIYARGPNGQERMFEYREGGTVDGSQFRSWGNGEWGQGAWNGGWEGSNNTDAGQYVILNAQYGTANRHMDVTNRLKELARQDNIFRMGNASFGEDPDPGHVKTLRIYARSPNGQQRMFEYREGGTVDGSQFRSWGSGEWGQGAWNGGWEGSNNNNTDAGQYVILSAQYGTANRHVDVTDRLKELARQDNVFRMGNGSFGEDPDPGHVKTLRIYARSPNGQERMFEYREGGTVDGSQFRSWSSGEWGNERHDHRWEGHQRER